MKLLRILPWFLWALFSSAHLLAQSYPTKPIRMLAPYPPGGGVDIAARTIGQKLSETFGQQIIVDNRPGAAGNIGMEIAARAAPDGYTLIMSSAGPVAMNPGLYPALPFDPLKDFAPVALAASTVYALVVPAALPVKSVKDLIALAKAQPGKLTYASSGVGGPPHLAFELMQLTAGIRMIHVPYKGAGPALADLLGGQVTAFFADLIAARPHLASGRLRALGVSSAQRAPSAPDVPTIAEAGLPGYEATGWSGVLAPAGTPRAIIQKLNAEIVRVLPLPDVKERLAGDGSEFGKNTPEQFARFIRAELEKWRKVIKTANVRLE
jgi:tripartite-type tricarboxylate transporter receptor subunit TctC